MCTSLGEGFHPRICLRDILRSENLVPVVTAGHIAPFVAQIGARHIKQPWVASR